MSNNPSNNKVIPQKDICARGYDEDETINESLVEVDDQLCLFDLDNDPHPF